MVQSLRILYDKLQIIKFWNSDKVSIKTILFDEYFEMPKAAESIDAVNEMQKSTWSYVNSPNRKFDSSESFRLDVINTMDRKTVGMASK